VSRLLIFPNDPISALVRKGSIRKRYFNPGAIFDEVHIMSPGKHDEIDDATAKALVGDAKLRLYSCDYDIRTSMFPILSNRLYLRLRSKIMAIQPDIVRAYNPILAGLLALQVRRDLGVPVVVSVHTDYWRDQFLVDSLYRGRIFRAIYYFYQDRVIAPAVLREADVIICKYKYVYEWAKKHGAHSPILIYNQLDPKRFACPERVFKRISEPKIVTTGRLEPIKNVEVLIKALTHCRGSLTIIGDGSQRKYLQDLVAQLGLQTRVRFEGYVPNWKLKEYYCVHDIFASATYGGGVGVSMLEAMAAGLPLVLSINRWDKTRDVAKRGAVLVEPTPQAFAKVFQELAANPEMRRDLSLAGISAVRELNGEKGEADVYLSILKENGGVNAK